EDDGLYIGSCEESVGTLIKKAALNSYNDYHNLDYDEKSIVALGLNSIIDLSHFSTPQKRLFSDSDWNVLRSKY
ncbi:uncharacterized protein EV154DRAFT_398028, partial [Mucor mucedo]|uniref:uncharacterized protein n=1 Tax=Mucor mucedo TaxID=29922 RepID=UPI0022210763